MLAHNFDIASTQGGKTKRIIDLVDNDIIGVPVYYKTEEELANALQDSHMIKVKVKGYRVVIMLETGNPELFTEEKKDYVENVLEQMADYFKENVLDKHPSDHKQKTSEGEGGWSTTSKIILAIVLLIAAVVLLLFLSEKIWGVVIFILCGAAFLPEIFKEKR